MTLNGLGRDCVHSFYTRCRGQLGTFYGVGVARLDPMHLSRGPDRNRVGGTLSDRTTLVGSGVPSNTCMFSVYVRNERVSDISFSRGVSTATLSNGDGVTFVVNDSFKLDSRVGGVSSFGFSVSRVAFPRRLTHYVLLRRVCETFRVSSNKGCRGWGVRGS